MILTYSESENQSLRMVSLDTGRLSVPSKVQSSPTSGPSPVFLWFTPPAPLPTSSQASLPVLV